MCVMKACEQRCSVTFYIESCFCFQTFSRNPYDALTTCEDTVRPLASTPSLVAVIIVVCLHLSYITRYDGLTMFVRKVYRCVCIVGSGNTTARSVIRIHATERRRKQDGSFLRYLPHQLFA